MRSVGCECPLHQDRFNAGIQSLAIFFGKIASCENNDGDATPCRMLLYFRYELKPVHLRHHEVENYDIRLGLLAAGLAQRVHFRPQLSQPVLWFEPGSQVLALHCVIFDHKHPRRPLTRPKSPHEVNQLVPINRLGEISGSTERIPCRRSSTMVAMTTGISASAGSPRNADRTVQPSMSGIMTSRVIAIG